MIYGSGVYALDYDDELVDTLKIEANHNIQRLKSFRKDDANNRIFENEREKGLGEFFEDQEKWDLIRERGLLEYRKQKHSGTQSSGDYKQDLKEKAELRNKYEQSRQTHVKTRDKIRGLQPQTIAELEAEELQLYLKRPRYQVRNRRKNKWVASTTTAKPGSGSAAPGFQSNLPPVVNEFPPAPDFPPAPAPYEGFEEIPPPPIYDSNLNNSVPYDPAFGGEMAIPPPPPPPPDYDF